MTLTTAKKVRALKKRHLHRSGFKMIIEAQECRLATTDAQASDRSDTKIHYETFWGVGNGTKLMKHLPQQVCYFSNGPINAKEASRPQSWYDTSQHQRSAQFSSWRVTKHTRKRNVSCVYFPWIRLCRSRSSSRGAGIRERIPSKRVCR